MHYLANNEWQETQELIEPFESGAVARFGPHKVIFAANLNTAGAIDMEMPDGKRLRSHLLGLAYYDTASGQSALIAEVKDCQGQIVGSNQVLYADAVTGCKADVRYSYVKSGFRQDVILREQPPGPEKFGMNPNTTRLQVLTEFLDSPVPIKRVRTTQTAASASSGRVAEVKLSPNEDLDFGLMKIGLGRAFLLGSESKTRSSVPVSKQFLKIEERDILIEEVLLRSIQPEIKKLPKQRTASILAPAKKSAFLASSKLPLPKTRATLTSSPRNRMLAASSQKASMGYVLDYDLQGYFVGDFTFQGDTTYFVRDGGFAVDGVVTFEGGTVIKTEDGGGVFIDGSSPVFKSGPYNPVIFTSKDDDSVGLWDWSSTGEPAQLMCNHLTVSNPNVFTNEFKSARFLYAEVAIWNDAETTVVRDCQFLHCGEAVDASTAGGAMLLRNVLFVDCGFPTSAFPLWLPGAPFLLDAQHVTADQCGVFFNGYEVDLTLQAKNCVFANVGDIASVWNGSVTIGGDHNGFNNTSPSFGTSQFGPVSNPFQTSGGGGYYLTGSDFRGKGTTAIDATLLDSLKTRTTQPPIEFPRFMTVSGELTLFPQISRYVSGAPDLGYHYDALDYTVAVLRLAGGNLFVKPGTAVGVRSDYDPNSGEWTYVGFDLQEGSSLSSRGAPEKRNVFAMAKAVQEATIPDASSSGWMITFALDFWPNESGLQPPILDLRFSDIYAARYIDYQVWGGCWEFDPFFGPIETPVSTTYWNLKDCRLYNGGINLGPPTWVPPFDQDMIYEPGAVNWDNCLFHRVGLDVNPTWFPGGGPINVDLKFQARNNLFRDLRFHIQPTPAEARWLFTDNLFDKVAFQEWYGDENPTPIDHDYNGYWRRTPEELFPWQLDRLPANDGDGGIDAVHDMVLTESPAYHIGPMGEYYLPTSSPLWNAGSRTPGEAGLFHYTTRLDQTKEGTEGGNVNIGLHYVATASSSSTQPKDSETPTPDGIPDYVEDQNGDGVVDANETSPALAMTDGTTPDATSTVYDDIDLDGDGMVGRIERALTKNPLVHDNPLGLELLLPQARPEKGAVELPISFSTIVSLGNLQLCVDGSPFQIYTVTDNGAGRTRVSFNTTFLSPGEHLFSVTLSSGISDSMPQQAVLSAPSPLLKIDIDNILQFNPMLSDFTEVSGTLFAQLVVASASYEISIYNPAAGPSAPPFAVIPGTTDNGIISTTWDSSSYPADTASAVFAIYPLNAPPETRSLPLGRTSASPGDLFTVAYGHTGQQSALTKQYQHTLMQFAVVDILLEAVGKGLNGPDYESALNIESNPQGGGGQDGRIGDVSPGTERQDVLDSLANPNTRNFFFFGHGTATEIGGAWTQILPNGKIVYDPPYFLIRAKDVAGGLGNVVMDDMTGNLIWQRQRPYRLVFMDACFTGQQLHWATAFGIGPSFTSSGTPYWPVQCFAGFKTFAYGPYYASEFVDYETTYAFIFTAWMNGMNLEEILRRSQVEYPLGTGGGIHLTIPLGGHKRWVNYGNGSRGEEPQLRLWGYSKIKRVNFDL